MSSFGSGGGPVPAKPVQLPPNANVEFVEIKSHWTAKDASGKLFTVYRMSAHCDGATPETWDVYRRYSDFQELAKELKRLKCRIPPLPPKNPFGFQDESFLKAREKDLEQWMIQMAELPIASSGVDPIKTEAMLGFLIANADRPPTVVSAGALRSMDSRAGGSGFGRWKSKVLSRMSYQKGVAEEDDEDISKDRQTSTALPVGFAVDLEEELARANGGSATLTGTLGRASSGGDSMLEYPPEPPPPEDEQLVEEAAALEKAARGNKASVTLADFEVLRVIGQGSFGKVFLVQKKGSDDTVYAMKVLKKDFVKQRRQIEHTRTERKVLGTVRHPFIVGMHYAFQSPQKLFFVLDYCPGGELFFWLSREKRLPEHMSRFYTSEITLALAHLHSQGVVYRDLKPENILLDKDGHVKLADFGLAKEGVENSTSGAFSLCGTPEYLAPEILLKKGHGLASDWWNMGMVLYEMLTGLPPWYTTDRQLLFERLKSAKLTFPGHISGIASDFISKLLVRDPHQRLGGNGSEEVKSHPFFTGIDWQLLFDRRYQPPFNPCTDQDITSAENFESEFRDLEISASEDIGAHEPNPDGLTREHRLDSETFAGFSFQPESVMASKLSD